MLSWHLLKGGLKIPELDGVKEVDKVVELAFKKMNRGFEEQQQQILESLSSSAKHTKQTDPAIDQHWTGYYRDSSSTNKTKHDMSMTVTVKSNRITGVGKDQLGAFKIDGDCFGLDVSFRKQYASHTIFYQGSLSLAKNTMHGHWGYF